MKINRWKFSQLIMLGITAFSLTGTAFALVPNTCQQTEPPADFVEITGGTTSCDPFTQMCCEIPNGVGYCDMVSPTGVTFPEGKKIRVHSTTTNIGEIHWWVDESLDQITLDNSGETVDGEPLYTNTYVDKIISVGASGGSNCFYGYEPDQKDVSGAGYVKNNGNFSGVQKVLFFSDGVDEFPKAPLANVPNCDLVNGNGMVADVSVTCPIPGTADGSMERWIIVAEARDFDGNKRINDLLGFIDPETGDIDPSNFCKCNKGDNDAGEDKNCNPNPDGSDPNDEYYEIVLNENGEPQRVALPICALDPDEALPTPVVIELQNPTCIGAGSSRRCY